MSWANSQKASATGEMLNKKGVKRIYILSLDYAAGKQVVGEDFVPLYHKDWFAELAKIKAAKPDGVVVFYPGSWGPKFFTQFNQSGLNKMTPLYHIWSVGLDNLAIFQKNNINVLNSE